MLQAPQPRLASDTSFGFTWGQRDSRFELVHLNLQLSFKRMNSLVFLATGPAGEVRIFKTTVSAILALSYPVMRAYQIQGPGHQLGSLHRVWLVLILWKRNLAIYEIFWNTDNDRNLTFIERLGFCLAIGSALHTAHVCRQCTPTNHPYSCSTLASCVN